MQSYLIVGPRIDTDLKKVKNDFTKNAHPLKIYGNGKDEIDCDSIKLEQNSRVIIHSHGDNIVIEKSMNELAHFIDLCSVEEFEEKATAFSLKLLSKSKSVNFELFSCYSGNAVQAIKSSTKFSTLITFTAYNTTRLEPVDDEIFSISSSFIAPNNPFIQFTSYLFTNPDTVDSSF